MQRRTLFKSAGALVAGLAVSWPERELRAAAVEGTGTDLLIEIGGLCVFAAQRSALLPSLGTVYALLPNTSKLKSGHFDTHTPMLTVRKDDATIFDSPDHEVNGDLQYWLVDQDVALLLDGSPVTGPVATEANVSRPDKTRRLDLCPPYDAAWSDVAFIADLDGILGGPTATINPDLVKPSVAAGSKVAARMVFNAGKLIGAVPRDPWGRHIAWGFNDPSPMSEYQQAITDIVEYHAPGGHRVQLVITHRQTQATRQITLAAGAVTVRLTNLAQAPGHCDGGHDKNCPPHHFYAYYELLKDDPAHRPTPGPMFLCGTHAQISNFDPPIYCPPPLAYYA
jgi:hypothetical protein